MPTKLKDLKITSTDLVPQGANPDAHVKLYKRGDNPPDGEAVDGTIKSIAAVIAKSLAGVFGKVNSDAQSGVSKKDAKTFDEEMNRERLRRLSNEVWNITYALNDSLSSIICDDDLTPDAKQSLMFTSLDEFAETMRDAIEVWAQGESVNKGDDIMKSRAEQAAFDAFWAVKYTKSDENSSNEEETDTMKLNKSKMTATDLATLADLEKRYGDDDPESDGGTAAAAPGDAGGVAKKDTEPAGKMPESTASTPELHPEVKKALEDNKALAARVEELQKNLEMKDLTGIAKKYEIIGKKADELAPKLYAMKKAGGTAYDDTIALLNEQVALVEKSGLFGELGSNMSGGMSAGSELDAKASEIRKANTGMSSAEALAKAYETYPELASQYEKMYQGRQ